MPIASIVIPAYRVTGYIAETLESVFRQTSTGYEVIVVNDCCPDTPALEQALEPYRDRIRYLKHEQNKGASAARNTGILAAESEFVVFLDADDLLEPNYLAVQLGMMKADPSIDVLYCNARFFGGDYMTGRTVMELYPSEGEADFIGLISLRCVVNVAVTARRETLVRVGLMDVNQRLCEDFEIWLRIANKGGKIAYHRQVLHQYRRRGGSQSSDNRGMIRSQIGLYEKVAQNWKLTPAEREALVKQREQFCADLALTEGKLAFEAGNMAEAQAHLADANRVYRKWKLSAVLLLLRVAPGLLRWVSHMRVRMRSAPDAHAVEHPR